MHVVFSVQLEDPKFIRLPPPNTQNPFILRFILPAGHKAMFDGLSTNYPVEGVQFERNSFRVLPFQYDFITDAWCDITILQSGAFEYKVGEVTNYFIVDPYLTIRSRDAPVDGDQVLNMDSICLLTVVPKWMGPLSDWREHMQWISRCNYNMIHFVPLQQRGASNSPYSIYDQLMLSEDLFEKGLKQEQTKLLLKVELDYMKDHLGLMSVTDIVWNHSAHNSKWLESHPEAGYNLKNSPHLRPAVELDSAIIEYSSKNAKDIGSFEELTAYISKYKTDVFYGLNLWQFYVIDVVNAVKDYVESTENNGLNIVELAQAIRSNGLNKVIGQRFGTSLNQNGIQLIGKVSKDQFKRVLDEVNLPFYKDYDTDVALMFDNITKRASYERLDEGGPKLGQINATNPLVSNYFTHIPRSKSNVDRHDDELVVANNGWIWNADPLVDFAGPQSKSYLVREVIPWGDCVKLRYGQGPDDNPWLWQHIGAYTCQMAELFHGFRIDNCHSTPLHVAQYFLDMARRVKTNLYVIAELFTGSEEKDITFVSKLGINSLIREAMNAWDSSELSRLVHRYGGQPVGSLKLRADYLPPSLVGHQAADVASPMMESFNDQTQWIHKQGFRHLTLRDMPIRNSAASLVQPVDDPDESGRTSRPHSRASSLAMHVMIASSHPSVDVIEERNSGELQQLDEEVIFHLTGSMPHALFMDCTHDNQTSFQKRLPADYLSSAALVTMADCAIGSVRGFDELYPYHLNVVTESRRYQVVKGDNVGIFQARRVVNQLHYLMGQKGYSEIHVHQENDFISVYRQNPLTHHGYLLIARTAFKGASQKDVSPVVLRNTSIKALLSAKLTVQADLYQQNDKLLTGLPSFLEVLHDDIISGLVDINNGVDALGSFIKISPLNFPSGSILLLETDMYVETKKAISQYRKLMNVTAAGSWYLDGVVRFNIPDLQVSFEGLGIQEMNVILYRCEEEERDSTGCGVYSIPGYGPLAYAGLAGFNHVLRSIKAINNLGHPICANLREGYWAMDYLVERLHRYQAKYPSLEIFINWLSIRFDLIRQAPNFLVPKYFAITVATATHYAQNHCFSLMSDYIRSSNKFVRYTALGAVQLYGLVPSTGLTPLDNVASVAAGLPHFTTNHMRCWGRDVFIALKGLYMVTGLHDIAKQHILAFASTLKHGLIPNLLDSGRRPRYNARDAVWWFFQSVQDYCSFNGLEILDAEVKMRFDSDEFIEPSDVRAYKHVMTLRQILYKILSRHAQGIEFREWNAGSNLDHAMRSEGFDVKISLDVETGLIFGGNRFNCGTWMDKMGDSDKAGIRGIPATPRDGAPIEIIGLLKSSLRWICKLAAQGQFQIYVALTDGSKINFQDWNDRLQANFERCFYVPLDSSQDEHFDINFKLVQRRGIYKDVYKSSLKHADYQLRPNLVVAMAVAPELFTKEYAYKSLTLVGKKLLGPLGLKTLDPYDPVYRGDYDNANDSCDPTVAHGINYHQGPEWLWQIGFFLRSLYQFRQSADSSSLIHTIQRILQPHRQFVYELSPYGGLPELTNSDGQFCADSCATQAWSMASVLDLLYELKDEIVKCEEQN